MAQRTVFVISRKPFVQAARVIGVRAAKPANLRIIGEVLEADSTAFE